MGDDLDVVKEWGSDMYDLHVSDYAADLLLSALGDDRYRLDNEAKLMRAKAQHAADVLDAWATAIRGDWSDIDGRTCRDEIETVSAYLRADDRTLTLLDVGVCNTDGCPTGIGSPHWQELSCVRYLNTLEAGGG